MKEGSGVSSFLKNWIVGIYSMAKKEEKWITLKEASRISGYDPDYIGELIRKGKIPGKQVFYNVAWMTTREAILEYKERQKRGKVKKSKKEKFYQFLEETKRKILVQFEILKLFFTTFKSAFIIFLVLVLMIFSLFFYLFSSIQQKAILKEASRQTEIIEGPTF